MEKIYPYYNLNGKLIENEHDENMRRKYVYNYGGLKEIYPDVYKLPEEEIKPMIRKMYDGKNMSETADDITKQMQAYISEKEPEWKVNYFGEIPQINLPKPVDVPNDIENSKRKPSAYVTGNPFSDVNLKQFREVNNKQPSGVEKIMDKVFGWSPEYQSLKDAKFEMEVVNKKDYDNYAHRLGMCRNGQMTNSGYITAPALSTFLGFLKECKDVYEKLDEKKLSKKEIFADTYKDFQNNFEALNYGLNNPDKDCRVWLENLDYRNNEWKE